MTMLMKSPLVTQQGTRYRGIPIKDIKEFIDATEAVDYITEIYKRSCNLIKDAFDSISSQEAEKDISATLHEACYPFVGVCVTHENLHQDASLSFGVITDPGVYGTTLTRPDIFRNYYIEQLSLLIERHKVPVIVGLSDWPIPLPFVIDQAHVQLDVDQMWQVQNGFVLPNLTRIDDNIANGTFQCAGSFESSFQCPLEYTEIFSQNLKPLALFPAERVDYSLHRLHHYTGTAPEHFQNFVLLTNYQRYIDEFIGYGLEMLQTGNEYEALVSPGNVIVPNHRFKSIKASGEQPKHLPQMPTYHLKRPDGNGVTFINIGIGPSNAKNITDHLAVLRPHCWLMLGHCAGLRSTQMLGDYVLAHGYVREDHSLDQDLPAWVPLPPLAEVQVALQQAVENVCQMRGNELKTRMRTGTLLTTDNRNWELRAAEFYEKLKQSRAIAVDMESATVAANGFRFRVAYGTLLCVSDKPIHGEIKLRGMANEFYRQRISQHLKIGLETLRILLEKGAEHLHSRKLRGFDEPPFR